MPFHSAQHGANLHDPKGVYDTTDGTAYPLTLPTSTQAYLINMASGNAALQIDTSGDIIYLANAVDNTEIHILGTGGVTFGSAATVVVRDGSSSAFKLEDSSGEDYILLNTLGTFEQLSFGNSANNPDYVFLGSGTTTLGGDLTFDGSADINIAAALANSMQVTDGSINYINISTNSGTLGLLGNAATLSSNTGNVTITSGATLDLVFTDTNEGALGIADGSGNYWIWAQATGGSEELRFGQTTLNQDFSFEGSGDVYLSTGALRDATGSAGTSGYVLSSTGTSTAWVAAGGGGAFDPADINITDNTAGAFNVESPDAGTHYININTGTAGPLIELSSATNNAPVTILGTGLLTVGGDTITLNSGAGFLIGNTTGTVANNSVALGGGTATAAEVDCVTVGDSASSGTGGVGQAVSIGSAAAAGQYSTIVGYSGNGGTSSAGVGHNVEVATGAVAVGYGSGDVTATYGVSAGYQAGADGNNSIAIGRSSGNGANANSVALGYGSTNTAANQLLLGSSSAGVVDLVLGGTGDNVTSPYGSPVYWRVGNGSGANDINGTDLRIEAGAGTGGGDPGTIEFRTATTGTPATSTAQTMATRLTIDETQMSFSGDVMYWSNATPSIIIGPNGMTPRSETVFIGVGTTTLGSGGTQSTVVGVDASVSQASCAVVGNQTTVGTAGGFSCGVGADGYSNGSTSMWYGRRADVNTAIAAFACGYDAEVDAGLSSAWAMGRNSWATASNQVAWGDYTGTYYFDDFAIGASGASASPPAEVTIRSTNGSGTNIAASDLTIRPGLATGNAAGGRLILQTAETGSTGSTLQTARNRVQIDQDGLYTFNGLSSGGTNANVYKKSGATQTTDAAAKAIVTIPFPSNVKPNICMVRGMVMGVNTAPTSGDDDYASIRSAYYLYDSSWDEIAENEDSALETSVGGASAQFVANGSNLELQVTGVASETWEWSAYVEMICNEP